MQEELNIGRGSSCSFQQARRVRDGAIGSLRHGESFIARLLHDLDEADGIVRKDETIRIQRNDIGRVWNHK